MRPIALLVLSYALTISALQAQNLQLHYDAGHKRDYLTATLELFKPDAYGSTFFFVDFNFDTTEESGMSQSYLEFARSLRPADYKGPAAFHLEYNGGHGQFETEDGNRPFIIANAWLAGPEFSWKAKDFSQGVTLQTLYKYIEDKHDASFQITLVWFKHLFDRALTFKGFADFWGEEHDFNFDGKADTEVVFLAEPQLWWNCRPWLSVGTEVEFGYNFGGKRDWGVNPTLAVKYNF